MPSGEISRLALEALQLTRDVSLWAGLQLMVADVAGRELLHQPLPGATELIEICLVGTIFACLPVISWRETHVVADLFDRSLGRTGMTIARAFGSLLGAVIFVLEFMAAMCALTAVAFAARAAWIVRYPDTPPGASGL